MVEMERLTLALERIKQIKTDSARTYTDFFCTVADFIIKVTKLKDRELGDLSLEELKNIQSSLYEGIESGYELSVYNPDYMQDKYPKAGRSLALLAYELRNIIQMLYRKDHDSYVSMLELFLEIYTKSCLDEDEFNNENIEDIIYWYFLDYLDINLEDRIGSTFTLKDRHFIDIIKESDLSDPRYLYKFGVYISDSQIELAKFLASLDEDTVKKMAQAYTEGYKRGFELAKKDLAAKKYVQIRYYIGFERVIKAAVSEFRQMGLEAIITPAPYRLSDKNPGRNIGAETSSPNKQCDYDHRYDNAILVKKAFLDRKLAIYESVCEKLRFDMALYAGPAVLEVFGEKDFEPENSKNAYIYNEKKNKLFIESRAKQSALLDKYVNEEEISFTIIAWPLPDIADTAKEYEEIFDKIIKINTLDSDLFTRLQQIIIDTLDKAHSVRVIGKGNNKTDIKVSLHQLKNPQKESNFENCTADVNIPVGEVFTSPVLKGTTGIINVSKVYIGDHQFKDLELEFKDGMVLSYNCKNFNKEEENKELIKEVILKKHDTLPMGEFAIGTNTLAYAIAKKYDILRKLPILIVEKTGPHFAVGDTCYSHEEDFMTYNPDGKAIVARENEISALRHEDRFKAYYNCHTDITIPYDEIDAVIAYTDHEEIYIIKDCKFALEGLEELNSMFDSE